MGERIKTCRYCGDQVPVNDHRICLACAGGKADGSFPVSGGLCDEAVERWTIARCQNGDELLVYGDNIANFEAHPSWSVIEVVAVEARKALGAEGTDE